MGRMFNLDSPVMQFLNKVADLMILNIITMICCIPVITAGASLTAMHYVLIRFVRKEEGYTVKPFFKAFKENFLQATAEWLIMLAAGVIFGMDILIMRSGNVSIPKAFLYIIIVIAVLFYILIQLVFPLQMRFVNPVKTTFKNSVIMSVAHLPRVFLMAVITLAPIVLPLLSFQITPLVIMFGFSLPGAACAYLYSPIFKKFEPEEEVVDHPDEAFFISDEMLPDPNAPASETEDDPLTVTTQEET